MKNFIKRKAQWFILSSLVGLFAGVSASLFLWLTDFVTLIRVHHRVLIFGLPCAGFLTSKLYSRYGKNAAAGNALVIDAVHNPQLVVPFRMGPLILFSTVLTHLFGGSAGREGAAVQMSASLSVQLARWFQIDPGEKRILLMAGTGAGFGAMVGAPWAGMVFGLEVMRLKGALRWAALECFVASWVGYFVAKGLQAPHPHLPPIEVPRFDLTLSLAMGVAGLCFGAMARIFVILTHKIRDGWKSGGVSPEMATLITGACLAGLFFWEGTLAYAGLSIPLLHRALEARTTIFDSLFKLAFTAWTVGGGFKGGEYVPLVVIGSTLGNALGQAFGLAPQFFATLGYVSVFGGAAKTPLACTFLAMGLFGGHMGPYALLTCGLSFWVAGDHGIYHRPKSSKSHR